MRVLYFIHIKFIPCRSKHCLPSSLDFIVSLYFMCTTCINTYPRVPLTARRLTINFERNPEIATLSETDVSSTLTVTSTFAIYDTLVIRPPDTLSGNQNETVKINKGIFKHNFSSNL